jgi:hypothetical protein
MKDDSMTDMPHFLSDEEIDRANALGRTGSDYLVRRERVKAMDPVAKVEPDQELMRLLSESAAAAKAGR